MTLAVLILIPVLVLASCGGSADTTAAPEETPATGPSPTPRSLPTETVEPTETPVVTETAPPPTPAPASISAQNLNDLSPIETLSGHEAPITAVKFSPDGTILASASEDGKVILWDIQDGSLLRTLEGHTDDVNTIDFSPDGSTLASGSNDQTIRIWSVEDGTLLDTIESRLLGRVLKLQYSPTGNQLVVSGHRCFSELRSTFSGILQRTLRQPTCVERGNGTVSYWGTDFNTDGSLVYTAEGRPCCGGSIVAWETDTLFEPSQLIEGHQLRTRDLDLSPDGETLAVAVVTWPTFWLMDATDGSLLQIFEGHTFRTNSVNFSPDGSLLASASTDKSIKLWDPSDATELSSLTGHEGGVNTIQFSPDGSLLASGSDDNSVIIWGLPPS
jgi:WD40 repeat protein